MGNGIIFATAGGSQKYSDMWNATLPKDLQEKFKVISLKDEQPLEFIRRSGLALSQIRVLTVEEIRAHLVRVQPEKFVSGSRPTAPVTA